MSEHQDALMSAFLFGLCTVMWVSAWYMAQTMPTEVVVDEQREIDE